MVISQRDPDHHIMIAPSLLFRNQEATPSLMSPLPFYLSPNPHHLGDQVEETYRPEKLGREILEDFLDNEVEAGRSLRFARYHTVCTSNGRQCALVFRVHTSLLEKKLETQSLWGC